MSASLLNVSATPSLPPALFLEYLSALRADSPDGTLPRVRFRNAVASFSPSHQRHAGYVLDDLVALGHVERSANRERWGMCPPALVGLPDRRTAVLTGSRSRALVTNLINAATRVGLGSDGVAIVSDAYFVETVRISVKHEQQLAEIAHLLGIKFLPDAARRLATCLPSINALVDAAKVASIDYEPGLERLDDSQLAIEGRRWAWSPVEFPSMPGVYRRVEPGRVTHWLRREHDTRRCDRATVIYGRFRTLLKYDEGSHIVTVHREALPPDLHRRTLTLCSGHLPVAYDQKQLAFGNVPADIAGRVANSLLNEIAQ